MGFKIRALFNIIFDTSLDIFQTPQNSDIKFAGTDANFKFWVTDISGRTLGPMAFKTSGKGKLEQEFGVLKEIIDFLD